MPYFQLDRFAFKAEPLTRYALTELDGVTPKVLFEEAAGLTVRADNFVTTDAFGTGYAYIQGDAQLRHAGTLVRDQIRVPYEFNSPVDPTFAGSYIRAIWLLTDEEKAEVYDPAGHGGRDLAPKLQAWLDAAYALTGADQTGSGGHGVWMDFDPGNWKLSGLQLKPGMALNGLSDRFEVRLMQTSDSQVPMIDILGRGQNQDVIGRRTSVHLYRLDINCNGELDANGDPVNGINLRIDLDNEGGDIDNDANRTGLIAVEVQVGGASGWGGYSLKRGKIWLSKCQFAGNGLAPLLPNNKVGGLFLQGPDCFLDKVYCGNNGGPQLHIKNSATVNIRDVEIGGKYAEYPSIHLERSTEAIIGGGGNCEGWILVEGEEDDNTADWYNTETVVTFYDFQMKFKTKSFDGIDGTPQVIPAYFVLKNIRGVFIHGVRVTPAEADEHARHYTYRPTNLVQVIGTRTRGQYFGPLPPLDDWRWPAGAPEAWPGSEPTNDYGSLTNHPTQLMFQVTDPSIDTHAWLFDNIRGLYNALKIDGVVQQPGAMIVPKTDLAETAIDVSVARGKITLTAARTWAFTNAAPTNGTTCGVQVKATGANRVVTLPAGVVDINTAVAVPSFTVGQNKTHLVVFIFMDTVWYIAGYPTPDPLANANLGNYADDAAAATGGVAVDGFYRTGSIVKKRIA